MVNSLEEIYKYSIQDNPNGIPDAINTALADNSFSQNLVVWEITLYMGESFLMILRKIFQKMKNFTF